MPPRPFPPLLATPPKRLRLRTMLVRCVFVPGKLDGGPDGVEPEKDRRRLGCSCFRFELDDCPRDLEGRGVRCTAEVRVDLRNGKSQRFLPEEFGVCKPTR